MVWPIVAAVGAKVLGDAARGYQTYKANQAQSDASIEALNKQIEATREQQANQAIASQKARDILINQGMLGKRDILKYNKLAKQSLSAGEQQALDALYGGQQRSSDILLDQNQLALESLLRGGSQADQYLSGGYGAANEALRRGALNAEDYLRSGADTASATIKDALANNKLQNFIRNDLQSDEGYQRRLLEGLGASDRSLAAKYGSIDAGAEKALQEYNRNRALSEESNFNARQLGVANALDTNRQNAATTLANLQQGKGQQLANQRDSSGTQLAQNAANQGYDLSSLNTNIGSQAAGYSANLGNILSSLYQTTGNQATGTIGNTGQALANLYGNTGTNLANLNMQNATNIANTITGSAAQNAALSQALMPAYQAPTQYAGQGQAAIGSTIGNMANMANNALLLGMMGGLGSSSTPYGSLSGGQYNSGYYTPGAIMG
jgi:hypothetical protein